MLCKFTIVMHGAELMDLSPYAWIRGSYSDVDHGTLVLQIPSALNRFFLLPLFFCVLFCFWTS